jgi:putative transposase
MMDRFRDAFSVPLMCRCLGVSRSGYYDWKDRPLSRRDQSNQALLSEIRQIHTRSDGVLGSPRIYDALRYQGENCSKNRVARLMRLNGIRGIPQVKQWNKKDSMQRPDGITNHLNRQFNPDKANTHWAMDITYIRTAQRWLYLAVVIDLYSKKVIGWSMSHSQTKELVLQAVIMAVWQRHNKIPVILHSDRGTQFTSDEYQQYLKDHGLICSMSAVGSCADNAAVEGFFGQLKRERVNRRHYLTHQAARTDVFDYIERFYNPLKQRKLEERLLKQSLLT